MAGAARHQPQVTGGAAAAVVGGQPVELGLESLGQGTPRELGRRARAGLGHAQQPVLWARHSLAPVT